MIIKFVTNIPLYWLINLFTIEKKQQHKNNKMEGFIWLQTSQKRFDILMDWLNKQKIFCFAI